MSLTSGQLADYIKAFRNALGNPPINKQRSYESSIALEETYAGYLIAIAERWERIIDRALREYLIPIGIRADETEIDDQNLLLMLDQLERDMERENTVLRDASIIAFAALLFSRRRMLENLSNHLGVPFPLQDGEFIDRTRTGFIKRNVDKISEVTKDTIDQIRTKIISGAANDLTRQEVYDSIMRDVPKQATRPVIPKLKNRMELIGNDQVQKVHLEYSSGFAKESGIDTYIWRTMMDERVRGNPMGLYPDAEFDHWSREGEVFRYDRPPEDGNPGEPVNCRCAAEPNTSFIFE